VHFRSQSPGQTLSQRRRQAPTKPSEDNAATTKTPLPETIGRSARPCSRGAATEYGTSVTSFLGRLSVKRGLGRAPGGSDDDQLRGVQAGRVCEVPHPAEVMYGPSSAPDARRRDHE